MKQFAVIGLDYFGKYVLEELLELDAEVLVIDKDRDVVDLYRETAANAVVLDVLNEAVLRHALPETVDGVVIDLGKSIEASILATSYCRKIGIRNIVVKAETAGHAEILEMVGATKIVFPNKEAAKRVVPLMASSVLLNYLPVSGKLVIAEISVPQAYVGKSMIQADLRKQHQLNVISVKNGDDEEYGQVSPDYVFRAGDVALVSGAAEAVEIFAGRVSKEPKKGSMASVLKRFFGGKK